MRMSSRTFDELGANPKQVRPQYWTNPSKFPDTTCWPTRCATKWPAPNLADKLLDAYFGRMNCDLPTVNELQFRQDYALLSLKSNDIDWLALAYCIFMVGSLYVSDERARANPKDKHLGGMQWWQAARDLIFGSGRVQKPLI
ncbi:uncharacterized protein MEPE_06605 [Melanopsichium pennsylvanicum]|uniref:Uncharacterized protein n=2 Tax=Melanopsichium pennsylvanicum TaxID=63383 RepID=A0AAJ4XRG1_9BASI|nr:uncharacterized protein BN887_01747 [Melanopsichium pennsylvanicum 4]SNX87894.1 uncharacterized protein MEPE_06605 [Melanopsichium pennsylvanicum]